MSKNLSFLIIFSLFLPFVACNPRTQMITLSGHTDQNNEQIESKLKQIPNVEKVELHPKGKVLIWTKDKKPISKDELQKALNGLVDIHLDDN